MSASRSPLRSRPPIGRASCIATSSPPTSSSPSTTVPHLTDFGIASTTNAAAESAGLSIPWSPPESFADVPRSDPRSDVYQLGATVYSLLAGRSPFELAGQRNTAAELIERIERMPLPPLGRVDAPQSLERALERAMAKAPADRYESALDFARALQKLQIELSHSVTPIDILDDAVVDDDTDDDGDGLTRVRGVVSIDPATDPAAGLTRPGATAGTAPFVPSAPPADEFLPPMDTVIRASPVVIDDVVDETVQRVPAATTGTVEPAERTGPPDGVSPASKDSPAGEGGRARSRRGLWIGLSAAVVAIIVVAAVSLPGLLRGPEDAPTPETTSDPQDPVSAIVPEPTDMAAAVTADGVRFTWTNPDPQDGDYYLYAVVTTAAEPEFHSASQAEVTVPADPSGTTCIDVVTVRANGQSSDPPTRGCTS